MTRSADLARRIDLHPRRLLHDLGSTLHSGFFRMRPELDDSDS